MAVADNVAGWEALADDLSALRGRTLTTQLGLFGEPEPVSPPVDFPAGEAVCVIPSGLAISALIGEIEDGQVPGVAAPMELFSDPNHLSPLGEYFHGLVHFAAIYRRSPEGVVPTDGSRSLFGDPLPVPAEPTSRVLQRVAWQTVNEYAKSGVNGPCAAESD